MINSVNSLEFLKSKLLKMDKYSSTTATKLLPPCSLTQARTFATISDHQKIKTIGSLQEKILNNEMKNPERVKVQNVENHTNLQNNKCNTFRTFYNNISASSNVKDREMFQLYQTQDDTEIDVVNVENLNSTTKKPLNIQNKCAFNVDFNNKYHNNNRIADDNNFWHNKNDVSEFKDTKKTFLHNMHTETSKMDATINESQTHSMDSQRTKDQDNAYRHIESVHNYAKSKSFEGDDDDKLSPNGSRHSSYLSDEDDDDDEEDEDKDNDGAEDYNDDNIDYLERLPVDLYTDYEDIFSRKGNQRLKTSSAPADDSFSLKPLKFLSNQEISKDFKKPANDFNILKDQKLQQNPNKNQIKNNCVDEEDHVDIDVETIEPQSSPIISDTNSMEANNCFQDESAVGCAKPDHHARRPMNAFLIFCKRHRAIVKDRYKNLENRAITKILGDWWASLESNEKKCFTNLAQQNKDAFFSANPNFKWYKLPAPPLRTLTTRPANTFGQEYQDDDGANGGEMISNMASCNNSNSNYFKLADEAQMGDLSQLMQNKSKTIKQCADLQQALSETSQYMSAHITNKTENLYENHLKRRFYNENSFSSNSSEEDILEPKKKSARSCKGKRYQELINSGQITTSFKKSKSLLRPVAGETTAISEIAIKPNCSNVYKFNNLNNNDCQKQAITATENMMSFDMNSFDLEEKIKELPALDLDDYLQRKRNTKKKKKFSSNGKKRGQRNASTRTDKGKQNMTNLSQNQKQQSNTAVGSQKRKARKESITRRDVSAIEQEVASLLPLTINGCCYFQEAPTAIKYEYNTAYENNHQVDDVIKTENDCENDGIKSEITYETDGIKFENFYQAVAIKTESPTSTSVSTIIIPVQKNSSSSASADMQNNTNVCNNNILNQNVSSSSTSDLLILAEVAANRTEIKR